jgi:RHS repeat-associated protein
VVDYYPFGSAMAGRKYNQGTYRYGFNGKEEDSEWGSQMIQDYGFRIYNPTIGKFLSVDPLTASYPMLTPYQFASNNPIVNIDLDGLEGFDNRLYQKNLQDGVVAIKNIDFGRKKRSEKGNYNKNYWKLRTTSKDAKGYVLDDLVLQDGVKASVAIRDIFQNPQYYSIDCGEACQLPVLYGLLKTVGDDIFDGYIESKGDFILKVDESTGLNTKEAWGQSLDGSTWYSDNQEVIPAAEFNVEEHLNNLPVGSKVTLMNLNANSEDDFQQENVIKLPNGNWAAIALVEGKSIAFFSSLDEVINVFAGGDKEAKNDIIINYTKEWDFSDLESYIERINNTETDGLPGYQPVQRQK